MKYFIITIIAFFICIFFLNNFLLYTLIQLDDEITNLRGA